tara:strand:- start:32 stop:1585 length:1554 start_codon:yes stop_codon:yes gene_type:complete
MSKRQEFLKRKNLSSNLKKYNAFSIYGYYPLFSDIETAKIVSPLTSYHIHEFEGVEYYMPNGLEMGKTQFHGNYKTDEPDGCNKNCVVLFLTSSSPATGTSLGTDAVHYFDFITGQSTEVVSFAQDLINNPGFFYAGLSMWGDKFYVTRVEGNVNYNDGAHEVHEYEIDWSVCKAKLSRIIYPVPVPGPNYAQWSNGVPMGFTEMVSSTKQWAGLGPYVFEWDIATQVVPPSGVPTFAEWLMPNGPIAGSIHYIASNNTLLVPHLKGIPPNSPYSSNGTREITHYDLNTIAQNNPVGNYPAVLGTAELPSPWNAVAYNSNDTYFHNIFCYGGSYYFIASNTTFSNSVYPVQHSIYKIELQNFSNPLLPNFTFKKSYFGDLVVQVTSNNPICSVECVDTSWDCIQIGDHPKFGFKCTEISGAGGQYATKQDCLNSGCEGIQPGPTLPTGVPSFQLPSQSGLPGSEQPEVIELPETIQPEVTRIIPPPVVIPEPDPEPTYIPPPPPTRSSGGGGSSGGY